MPLDYLLQRFDAIGPMGPLAPITIDQGFTGSAELTTLFRSVLGAESVTIKAVTSQISRAEDHLKIVGTATLLNMVDTQVTFLAREIAGDLRVTLEILIGPAWTFSDLLPDLPEHATSVAGALSGEKIFEPHFLDRLSLGTGRLILSNREYADEAYACTMVPGLNFVGELYFMSVLFTLGLLLDQEAPVRLTGPVKEFRAAPDSMQFLGVRLSAPLAFDFSELGPLTITKAQVFLKAGFNAFHRDYLVSATQDPGIYLLFDGALGGRPLQMIGKYDLMGDDDFFDLRGRFTDFAVSGFASLSQTVGVEGFAATLPEDLPDPGGLSLTEFGVAFSVTDRTIGSLTLGVGTHLSWEIIKDAMTLTEVSVTFVVSSPFSSGRSIATTLTGLLAFKKFSLAASATFPSFAIQAGLPAGETLPLGDVIASFLPGEADLPALTISQLLLRASPKEKSFSLSAVVHDLLSIPVGATSFDVAGLALFLSYDKVKGGARGAVTAQMRIADATVVLSGELNNGLTLSGTLQQFDLKKFWLLVSGGEALPDEIPDIVFETLGVRFTPKTSAFSLLGNATVAWDHLSSGASLSTSVQFSFSRSVTGAPGSTVSAFTASLSLQGSGPAEMAPGFTFKAFNFLFDYQTGAGWKLSGGITTEVFDTSLYLQAGYETTPTSRKFKLQAMTTPAAKLIDLEGVGAYSFKQLDLMIERVGAADGKKKTSFDLRLASTLQIDDVFTVGGYLSLRNAAEGASALIFQPDKDSANLTIHFPTGEGVGMTVHLFEIGFVKESAATGWAFTGTTDIGFTGLSSGVAAALPSRVHAKLVAGKNEARISALNVTDPLEIPLPSIHGKSMGKAVIQLTEVGIALRPQLGLMVEAGLGLPAELNAFLGGRQVFRVYQQGNPLSLARTRFTIAGTGVSMQFISSPFTGVNAVSIKGESWFDVDLGEYGALSLKMPTFVYDGVTQYFEAGGGCTITRPLAVPLQPLKYFLVACGLQSFADMFPDAIPVTGLSLVDKDDNLKVDELVAFVKKVGDIPSEAVKVLKETGKLLNHLPDTFKHYLSLEAPDQLEFKLGFSPAGRISVALLAPSKPVRVLFPSVVQSYVPMPGLTGIELRKLTVGTLMSGSLFFGEVDATIDQFDLPSLIVSLMLPEKESFPLPTSDQLTRRILLDDVFCIIPASQGLPIPIPIFYDQIGFEYLGIEGVGLGAHISFPKPPLGGSQAMAFFTALKEFTSDDKALLDPKTPPGGLDLVFNFRDEFLQAPEYLGGGVLGTRGKDNKISAWKYVAKMLNFGKTFSINDFVGAIPFEYRAGSAQTKFAFLAFDADWLLTTPAEFKSGAFEQLKLSASDRDDFMDVLPALATTGGQQVKGDEEGLVAFVRGQADLGFLRLEAVLGLAASGSMGFNTGFKLDGSLGAGVIEMELSGAVMVNAPLAAGGPATTADKALKQADPAVEGGQALSLNGKNAWVEIPASDSLLLPEYTIEIWLRPAEKQGEEWVELFGVDTFKNGSQRNYYLELNTKNAFYHHRFTDGGGGNSGAPNTPNGSVRWGQWQHIALTNDGATARTLLDGKEVASGPVNGALTLLKDSIFLGKVPGNGANRFFKGEIEEVRIWKRARTAAEIQAQMRDVLQGDEKDLVSLYRFDVDTPTRALDVCGRNHGKIIGGAFTDPGVMRLEGLVFNGSGDYIEVPDAESLRLGAYTVEAWFKPVIGKQEWACIAGKAGRNYSVYIHRDGYVHHRFHTPASTNDGAPNTPNGVVQWEQWNHVAITNDGKTARTFVNGVQQSEGPVSGRLLVDNTRLQIGRTADGADDAFFSGEIAEIRIWSRARSLDEIKASMSLRLRGTEASLVSLFRLDGATGDTLADVCGRNAGSLHVASTRQPVKLEHDGLVFSGQGDYALVPRSDRFKVAQYTVEAWIRPDKEVLTSWQCVWGGNGKAPQLYISDKGIVSHRFSSRELKVTTTTKSVGGIKVPVPGPTETVERDNVFNTDASQIRWGEWNHLAITHDGATFTTLVNGIVKSQGRSPGSPVCEAVEVNIGRSHDGKGQAYFRGSIDDLRFFGVARTREQIASDMHFPLTGKEAGIVAYYTMDHSSGVALTDLGPNRLSGVVSGAEWALAVAPAASKRAAIQIQGHTHLTVAGHEVMVGDLSLVDSELWFRGELDLFPKDWPIRVYGHVEGMLSKKRFYFSGETQNKLFSLVLSSSRIYVSNEQIRLEGRWLGAYTLLDISWQSNEPTFAGSVSFDQSPTLDFGAIRIAGVKVADNVRLSLDIRADLAVVISKKGFSASVVASFKINGKGFSLSFSVDVPPADLDALITWIKQKIIDDAGKYLAHLFSDAATWLKNVASGAIAFARDVGEVVGAALKSAFKVTKEALGPLMKDAGYAAEKVGAALGKAYGEAAQGITNLLKGADYAVENVGKFLKDFYGNSGEATGKLLKDAGYEAEKVGKALQSAYQSSADDAARALKNIGYEAENVGRALQSAYQSSAADAAKALRNVGYDAEKTGKALQSAYQSSADDAAKALKSAGYGAKEVGSALKGAFGKSADECKKALNGAGYAASETEEAFKDLGGDIASAGKTVEKGAEKVGKKIGKAIGL